MRNQVFLAMVLTGLLIGSYSTATAGVVSWAVMQDPSVAGKGPGPDDLVGTPDDTTIGENSSCNMTGLAGCAAGLTPETGAWSFAAMELDDAMLKSCLGGPNAGESCTTNEDCEGGYCIDCPQNEGPEDPWDTYAYMGDLDRIGGQGTITVCQEDGITFRYTGISVGISESIPWVGSGCANLTSGGGPNTSNHCGAGAFTSTADITFSVGACSDPGGRIENLELNGYIYPTAGSNGFNNCGYTTDEINSLRATAATKGGAFLLVMCGNGSILDTQATKAACLRGAETRHVIVAFTDDNADDCTTPCQPAGSCSGGPIE
jgi:hypothetical protein